jgi:hypothetical protein
VLAGNVNARTKRSKQARRISQGIFPPAQRMKNLLLHARS